LVVVVAWPSVEIAASFAVMIGAQTEFMLARIVLAVIVLSFVLELLLLLTVASVPVLLAEDEDDCWSWADDVEPELLVSFIDVPPLCADCCCAYAKTLEP
jgi:hypothetical protein